MADISKEYKTISQIAGPLVYVKNTEPVGYNEIVSIRLSDGTMRRGQVLDSSNDLVVVQVFEGTTGIDRDASVRFLGETMKMPVSREMLGRVLSGAGDPLDGGAKIVPEKELDITGAAINPWARDSPSDFIQTGISTIDGMNTLVRGQKLPIFSQSGLPHNEMALQIARQAKVRGENEEFAVVFIAMGITNEEKQMFMKEFERTGALKNAVVFLNLADDPAVERTLTPRLGLTTAEYMAFDLGMQVLVIMTDITNYCEALRQIGAAREEVPGRRGYPGYMYTDLAQLYERAGRIKGKKGSITQIPILSMPGGDITHPIPDLSGYITEGQIVLSMDLHRAGIYPPVNVSSSLSRLMGGGTGAGKTREDHKNVSDQLYASYAEGKDLRGLVAIVGKDSLSAKDRKLLDFADIFEEPEIRSISRARCLAKLGDSITTDHISPAGAFSKDTDAGRYLMSKGVEPKDFNSYGSRRANHEVMVRGTFANVRLRNLLVPGSEGSCSIYYPDGTVDTIFETSRRYDEDMTPLIILAGKEYGTGSSRDWAAKGPLLLGVKAVIAESFERIHRSNLVGMGIVPLQFLPGQTAETLGLNGTETFDIDLEDLEPKCTVRVTAYRDGQKLEFDTLCRVDVPAEVDYIANGGILQYVLRRMAQ